VGADAEPVDRRFNLAEALQQVFVHAAARENGNLLETSFVEDAPDLARVLGQIPAVEPDSFDGYSVSRQ
jgi:hypothetical protein